MLETNGGGNGKDFQSINNEMLNHPQRVDHGIPAFEDPLAKNKSKQSRKGKHNKFYETTNPASMPKRGTFSPPTFQELQVKSKDLFEKRHHILAKLSCNGIYNEIYEEDEDLIQLILDTLNQPDVLYKETAKAVVQSSKDSYMIQNLIKNKV